jgi:biofilm PGA synthesis N-glycosyltransferase PgaC
MMNYFFLYGSLKNLITIVALIVLIKYYFYLILAPFYSVQQAWVKLNLQWRVFRGTLPPTYEPLVTVIIPAWNEAVGILHSVRSVLKGSYQKVEIVIVNDGSTDTTHTVMQNFVKQYKASKREWPKIVYLSKNNGGKGSALNHGIDRAKGDIVVTMDADSIHHKHALRNMVAHFRDPSVDALVGNVSIFNNTSIIGSIQELEYLFGFYFKRVHSLLNAEYIFGGACAAFRKATTLDVIGHFDAKHKTEDIEYSMRTKKHGLKAVYGEDVVVYTEGANDLMGLYNQRLRWKKGRMDTFWQYRRMFFSGNKKHSKFLSWFVLPYAALGELQLLVEPIFFAVIWTYTFISGDFLSVGLSSLFIFFTFMAALFFGHKWTRMYYLFLFPAFWLLFYLLVGIEFMALTKSIELFFEGKDITWQKWERKGFSS